MYLRIYCRAGCNARGSRGSGVGVPRAEFVENSIKIPGDVLWGDAASRREFHSPGEIFKHIFFLFIYIYILITLT